MGFHCSHPESDKIAKKKKEQISGKEHTKVSKDEIKRKLFKIQKERKVLARKVNEPLAGEMLMETKL